MHASSDSLHPLRVRRVLSRKAWRSLAFAVGVVGACIVHAPSAHADVSSWLSTGGGFGLKHAESRGVYDRGDAFTLAVGVGTEPTKRIVVGGLLRTTTYFTLGTDLGLALRGATGGFARGQWGVALDLGPTWRTWGNGDYGRIPLAGMLYLGAPWGLQLGVGGEVSNLTPRDANAKGVVALLEIDFLRLTVMRQGSTDRWWENPSPAGGRMPREAR